jgi:acyl dehydratase
MTWGTISEEGIAEAESLVGVSLRRDRMRWIDSISQDAIRHFAWGVGDNNPLWLDPNYAANSQYGDIIAPPCILYGVDSTIVAPKLQGVQWLYAGTGWTWFEPIRLNDHFKVDAKLLKQETKSGRRFSKWVLQTGKINYFNQHGRIAATAVGRCARTPRGDQLHEDRRQKEVVEVIPHKYSSEEIREIERQVLAEPLRGKEPLYWEDVNISETIPQVVRGPLSVIDIMAWYSAVQGAQHYGGVHGNAIRYRQRHADYHINKATGTKEAAGRGHLESTTGKDVGMGGAYDIGPQRISWAQHMLTNWIGDHGFLHTLDISVRMPNLVGDVIWWRGTVTGKKIVDGHGLVQISLTATNQKEEISAFGTSTIVLPTRLSGPVVFPILRLLD